MTLESLLRLSLLLQSLISITLGNVACTTVEVTKESTLDDARAEAQCPNGYPTMVSCGGRVINFNDDQFDGAFIEDTLPRTCIAQNAAWSNGVIAIARCCKFPINDIECVPVVHPIMTTWRDDALATASCLSAPLGYDIMTGCSAHQLFGNIDGMYPGPQGTNPLSRLYDGYSYASDNMCTVQNGANVPSNGGTYPNLMCCRSPTYPMSCVYRFGAPNFPNSQVTCPRDYFMAGCTGYGHLHGVEGWWISENTCYTRGDADAVDVYASAICCTVTIPTSTPTSSPTERPTEYPTTTPTDTPTVEPTNSPTPIPTIAPTKVPTTTPTSTPTSTPTTTMETPIDETSFQAGAPANSSDDNSAMVGGLVGGLVFLTICLCVLGALAMYFWRRRAKAKGNDASQPSADVEMQSASGMEGVVHESTMMAGAGGAQNTTLLHNAMVAKPHSERSEEKEQEIDLLSELPDSSSDDEAKPINTAGSHPAYDLDNRAVLVHGDEDEDVLPK